MNSIPEKTCKSCGITKPLTLTNFGIDKKSKSGFNYLCRMCIKALYRQKHPDAKIPIDLTGQIFGRLTVLSEDTVGKYKVRYWICQCSCGNLTVIKQAHLRQGRTTSCGCYQQEARINNNTTHGMSRTPTFITWCGMIARCTNPNSTFWHRYGGRGVTVCERWLHSFENFLTDMGERPKGLTLERLDNNSGYSKENCVYASQKTQARNKCSSVLYSYRGESKTLAEIAEINNVNYKLLWGRVSTGWDLETAISEPARLSKAERQKFDVCTTEECSLPVQCKGLCRKCYNKAIWEKRKPTYKRNGKKKQQPTINASTEQTSLVLD